MRHTGWRAKAPRRTEGVNSPGSSRPRSAIGVAIAAIFFGMLSLKSGGSVLFIDGTDRAAAGNYVPFVLWFNFLAGFAYIGAGIGLFLWRGWAVRLSMAIAAATLLVFGALGVNILFGAGFEPRTVGAMILRSAVWLSVAFYARRAWLSGLDKG